MTYYRIDLSPVEKWLQSAVMHQLENRIDQGVLVPVEPDYDKHYALMRQWSKSITREEARILLDNSLGIGGDDA